MPNMPTSTSPKTQKNNILWYLTLPIMFLLGLSTGYLIRGLRTLPSATPVAAAATPDVRRVNISAEGHPSLGPEDAPITIIEFSDYQCPYCKLWHDNVYDRLLANYPGKIRFVYWDFPLNGHPEAQPAAEAARCAGAQNAYFEYNDAIFGEKYGLGRSAYLEYAQDLGLDVGQFTNCLDNRVYQSVVEASLNSAINTGIQSTPTFLINGIQVIGAESYETFKQVIDQELARQGQ